MTRGRPANANPRLDEIHADIERGLSRAHIRRKYWLSVGQLTGIIDRWKKKNGQPDLTTEKTQRQPYDPAAKWR